MALIKREYTDKETVITAKNLNDIQDAIIMLEGGLFTIDSEAKGEAIAVTDAANRGIRGLSIYGKTTQDGTPTPDNPVELVSVGNGGSITVNVTGNNGAQSMTIATPNGLPGIPVTSGGNYTDANGQQWICDEVDLARGVYVKRIEKFTLAVADMNNTEGYPGWKNSGISEYYPEVNNVLGSMGGESMCNIDSNPKGTVYINTLLGGNIVLIPNPKGMTQSQWKDQYPELVFELIFTIPAPIETPLSEEELAAYAALHTYRDHTTVSNDAGAYMSMEYVMDAKKYIDRISGGAASAVLANVTLKASAWVGSGNLYSQVVTIAGITANSQVNLTPTVSQMATFYEKDITFITENDGGVVTVYVIGQKPVNDYTIQANIVEVNV